MKKTTLWLIIFSFVFTAGECKDSSDKEMAEANEKLVAEANSQIGMPDIVNFEEKRKAKMLYELRDKRNYITHTYIVDMMGKLHKVCTSSGYGIPYSAQYSSPEKIAKVWGGLHNLPQAEPNGLFMPTSSSATWVICIHKGKPKAVYVEPTIIVSPFPLK